MIVINPPTDYCQICNRPIDELEVVNEYRLFRRTRSLYGTTFASWECADCVGVPIEPWEVYGEPDIFLLCHNLDINSWSTPVHKWEDKRIDRLLSGDKEISDYGWKDYFQDLPEYSFTMRALQPHEVEKIKAAPGKTIIVVSTRKTKKKDSGEVNDAVCRPPEIIKNDPVE